MSSSNLLPRPPYDPQLIAALGRMPPYPRSINEIARGRQLRANAMAPLQAAVRKDEGLLVEDRTIPGPRGEIPLVILQSNSPKVASGERPGVVYFHGGGMVLGDAFLGIEPFVRIAKELDAIIVSAEYRLAPEHPAPAPQDDCYAALVWTSDHAKDLGIDPTRLMVAGVSAGGGLAAGAALRARDTGGPKLCAQLLVYPMLDDRDTGVSKKQFRNDTAYDATDNSGAWSWVLGDKAGVKDADVSPYVAPGRATDLSGLPLAYIDVGTAEPFRDENVAYATKLWDCGVQADLHVWSGGFHGFDLLGLAVGSEVAKVALETRLGWVRRVLDKQ
ncbi:alpha/beta hydrolase domain protein [Colletotrichum tofieldiae]|uniref:Alpha/beta hydrolase domain protein n=1 Tax=Colletotrichum tofieldiae TaxID=708197 RepID=A0A166YXF9_9PEZI|nr:alpha/beta hydrolase domain protein [Colletotrichum tofieldiae]GKT57612.1 alpha/beta hydrolase domain protein [Colletotrichum tofieldiae]GKT77178.1 alpha/beta hydrolase domain protein [Colletotrichum tofieldiae]GKT86435.1 alpha/beta hydrolase domain protein [Colletotrichum tofieldiae]